MVVHGRKLLATVPVKAGASGTRGVFASLLLLRHYQIAGKSRVGISTASAPKGLADGTSGKLEGMVRT